MFRIPHKDRESFPTHFVREVFLKLQYKPIPDGWESRLSEFREDLASCGIVTLSPRRRMGFEVTYDKEKAPEPIIKSQEQTNGITGANSDSTFSFQMEKDSILFSSKKYCGFDDFSELSRNICNVINNVIPLEDVNSIGLRKIGSINLTMSSNSYSGEGINQTFFTPIRDQLIEGEYLELAENKYILKKENNFFNLIATARRVSRDDPTQFSLKLDFDSIRKFPNSHVPLSSAFNEMREMNELLFDVFCWICDDELLHKLRN
jgi:uncharacterized protein (TIGR04255 family)